MNIEYVDAIVDVIAEDLRRGAELIPLEAGVDFAISMVGKSYAEVESALRVAGFNPEQPRDENGKWAGDTFYHGTGSHVLDAIKKDGIKAVGGFRNEIGDRKGAVFITSNISDAVRYAWYHEDRQQGKTPIVLQIHIPKEHTDKLGVDELGRKGSLFFKGDIPPSWIEGRLDVDLENYGKVGKLRSLSNSGQLVYLVVWDKASPSIDRMLDEYTYQSTQINISEPLRSKILAFDIQGERETNPHITVKYGLKSGVTAADVAAICQGFGAIRVVLGEVDVFDSVRAAEEAGHPFHGNQYTLPNGVSDTPENRSIEWVKKGKYYVNAKPLILYHGTTEKSASKIDIEGLKYGNLATTPEYAKQIAAIRREGDKPVVYKVDALAHSIYPVFHGPKHINTDALALAKPIKSVSRMRSAEGRWATISQSLLLEYADRYPVPPPSPNTVCTGQCEGMGWIPVYLGEGDDDRSVYGPDETDPELIAAWYAADVVSKTDDGWHFVKCPECGGTGVKGRIRGLLRGCQFHSEDEIRLAVFDPSQARDEHGQWASSGGGNTKDVDTRIYDAVNHIIDKANQSGVIEKVSIVGSWATKDPNRMPDRGGKKSDIDIMITPKSIGNFKKDGEARNKAWKLAAELEGNKQFGRSIHINVEPVIGGKAHLTYTMRSASQGDSDVVKININSPDLHRLNKLISDLPHTDTHPTYQPHITLAYVPAGQGSYYKGISTFVGEEFTVDSLVFCDTDGGETTISFTPRAARNVDNEARDEKGQWSSTGASRAARALATYKPSTRAKQLKAAASEKTIAATLGGQDLPDNEPMDVIVKIGGKTHGVEVKTLIDNSNNKITCHPESRIRKEQWCRKNKAAGHTVVVDKRGATVTYYHREGFGAFRLAGMERVSLKDLKRKLT